METAQACWRQGESARVAGQAAAAAAAYRRVLALAPDFVAGHANLGLVLGMAEAALAPIGRAIALAPGHPLLPFNLGNVLAALGRPGAAGVFRRALALDPGMSGAWLNLGVVRHGEGRLAEAARAALRAVFLGGAAEAWNNLANARRDQGRVEEAIVLYERALAMRPDYADAARNRLAARLYLDDDDERAGEEARAFAGRHGAAGAVAARTDPDPDRLLRVGLLSSDLGDHPVGRNLAAFVAHRDPRAIWLGAYDTGGRGEAASAWFRRGVDLWREVAGLGDAAIAERIRADAIDVLVVLAGRFDRNRPLVASFRPAPVQVAMHDGGPSGMGAGEDPAVAAWITDRWLHPDGEGCGGDRLERLPVFYSFPRPDRAPPPHRPAADGAIRLGSFSNPAKLSGRCLRAWGRILAGLPGARLVLKYRTRYGDPEVRARIVDALAGAGGDPGRIVFVASAEDADAHLARYGGIDVALDPFPFSGATTSFEALAMGVPVLTRAGRAAIGRTTQAILGPLGLDELVAVSDDDYVARALALAGDPGRLRREIPERLARSALLDGPAYAAALAGALRRLWRSWCGKTGAPGPGLR